jgi:FlaA1/EpsC-like NDP-sugar epimerase
MGEPVRVMDLAHDLIRLAGRDPGSQPIETIGLRPGEKLHEELFYDIESVEPTESVNVLRAKSRQPPADVRDEVRRMLALATGDNEAILRTSLLGYVWMHDGSPLTHDQAQVGPAWEPAPAAMAAVQ